MSACRRETVGSSRRMSAVRLRPIRVHSLHQRQHRDALAVAEGEELAPARRGRRARRRASRRPRRRAATLVSGSATSNIDARAKRRSPQCGHSGIWSRACSATWKPQLLAPERPRSGERAGRVAVQPSLLGLPASVRPCRPLRARAIRLPRELVRILTRRREDVAGVGSNCPQSRCFRPRRTERQQSAGHADDGAAYNRGRMRPITVSRTVDAPREQVFGYLSDIANHAEFSDHYLHDFRLERLDSTGSARRRAGASTSRSGRQWGDAAITELEPPHRIVLEGRSGRIGRIPTRAEYRLTPADHGMTRVEYRFETRARHAVRPAEGVARPARLAAPRRPPGAGPHGARARGRAPLRPHAVRPAAG